MEAGRELDALVAAKVLGWEWIDAMDMWYDMSDSHTLLAPDELPEFSTDIAAAWHVVEHLDKAHNTWINQLWKEGMEGWGLILATGTGYSISYHQVHLIETVPLAICLAALDAIQEIAKPNSTATAARAGTPPAHPAAHTPDTP